MRRRSATALAAAAATSLHTPTPHRTAPSLTPFARRHRYLLCALVAAATANEQVLRQMPDDPQTLSQMLQWSLDNTDLDALHEKAERIRGATSADEVPGVLSADGNRGEVAPPDALPPGDGAAPSIRPGVEPLTPEKREALASLSAALLPNAVGMMREALERAVDVGADAEARVAALHDIQELVEDIDNARDFKAIDGFGPTLELLASDEPALQAAAAWVVGTAVQNQRELQLHLLGLDALPSLLRLLRSHAHESVRAKSLFATSCLVRNCVEAQATFEAQRGVDALLAALAELGSPRLVRKALVLLTDLLDEEAEADAEADAAGGVELLEVDGEPTAGGGGRVKGALSSQLANSSRLCDAVLQSLTAPEAVHDLDTQEKAVIALGMLLRTGIVRGGASGGGSGGCALAAVGDALAGLQARCEAIISRGDELADGCTDLLSLVGSVRAQIAADS